MSIKSTNSIVRILKGSAHYGKLEGNTVTGDIINVFENEKGLGIDFVTRTPITYEGEVLLPCQPMFIYPAEIVYDAESDASDTVKSA